MIIQFGIIVLETVPTTHIQPGQHLFYNKSSVYIVKVKARQLKLSPEPLL